MRLAGIEPTSVVDGVGIRYTIFTQGCTHNCKGCHNPETHDYSKGYDRLVDDILSDIQEYDRIISGITISGGDPLFILNYQEIVELCKKYKEKYPDKNIWLYTGYTYEEVIMNRPEILKYIDVLVDGEFKEDLKSFELSYRGSSNQRVIDVNNSDIENVRLIEYL